MKRLLPILLGTLLACACSDSGSAKSSGADFSSSGAGYNNTSPSGNNTGSTNGFVPETEANFEFAQPAVVGSRVFVANKTLNSVAVIDSDTLGITTVPVGFEPTAAVGPSSAGDGRVFVLNKGSSTVSIIDPSSLQTTTVGVLRAANALDGSPDGKWAVAWFDEAKAKDGEAAGDLSSVTVIGADGKSYQVAVGFRVERVSFTTDDSRALILSDDGVSTIDLATLQKDGVAAPVAVLPPDLRQFDRTDREVLLDPAGKYAIARVAQFTGVVLTDISTGDQWRVDVGVVPTDVDLVEGRTLRVLAMLRGAQRAFVAEVPDGLVAYAEQTAGTADAGAGDMGPADMGSADIGPADVGPSDIGAGADAGLDASVPDLPPTETPVMGFTFINLQESGLGAAQVAATGDTALLYTTVDNQPQAELLDLGTLDQRAFAFEKGVRGAVSDDAGRTFVVLHSKQDGAIPQGATPSDPEYIARSWGISIVDVSSGATRLVLTDEKPGLATLWTDDNNGDQLYMIFDQNDEPVTTPSLRDVLSVNLTSFATSTFRVPSLPDGLGRIDAARKIYIDQSHPQGRITFVSVDDQNRQTITGYQLNSEIH